MRKLLLIMFWVVLVASASAIQTELQWDDVKEK